MNIPNEPDVSYGAIQNLPTERNLLQSTRFHMYITRLPETTFYCQSINIPAIQIGIAEQTTTFNPIPRAAGAISHDILKANFLVDQTLKSWTSLREWMIQCSNYEDFTKYQKPGDHMDSTISILILNSNHNPTHKVIFKNAFPVILSGIELDSTNRISDYISANVGFAFTSYDIQTQ